MKKRGFLIFFFVALIVSIALAIIIPSIRTLSITSFDGATTFKITEYNLGKNIESDANSVQITVADTTSFYEKHIKQYTKENVPSNEGGGYFFYEGACFGYSMQNSTVVITSPFAYDGSLLSWFITDYYSAKVNGISYYFFFDEYDTVLNILKNIDDRYCEEIDNEMYLKCYDESDYLTDFRIKVEAIEYDGEVRAAIDPNTLYNFD